MEVMHLPGQRDARHSNTLPRWSYATTCGQRTEIEQHRPGQRDARHPHALFNVVDDSQSHGPQGLKVWGQLLPAPALRVIGKQEDEESIRGVKGSCPTAPQSAAQAPPSAGPASTAASSGIQQEWSKSSTSADSQERKANGHAWAAPSTAKAGTHCT